MKIIFFLPVLLSLLIIIPRVNGTLCAYDGSSSFYKEEIQYTRKRRHLEINGCPNHRNVCQYDTCGGKAHLFILALPYFPDYRQ